jgi:RNA-directed DNA polymerase
VEGRESRLTELLGGHRAGAQEPGTVSTKQQRRAKLAGEHPDRAFTSLAHHIDLDWLREAYRRTRKEGAVGVDGQTAEAYGADLTANLQGLLERAKSGLYQALPVRRVHIPKGDGRRTRPIGIPTFEDKVLQRAVAMVLEPLYEQGFLECSYGYRPNRSAHQALATLHRQLSAMDGGWVIELDIQAFFDTLDHALLREMLRQRVNDGVITRLMGKSLKAGVLEEGQINRPKAGAPQGGVISPLLANLYLHTVLDQGFEQEVKPRLTGRGFLVRFADDVVLGFSDERDARRVFTVLPKRFARFGLALHPTKTQLVRFQAPCDGQSRRGCWVIQRKTAKDRLRRALKHVADGCRHHRHRRITEQYQALSRKLQGHYAYYGISGNSRALRAFRFHAERLWIKWLGRRSQRARLGWDPAQRVLARFPLPQPRIVVGIVV